jgi:23S rRNA (guanine2445-N2)-methyltransferase / 23S rRNA (guanine2069-N7)-methyltransferase
VQAALGGARSSTSVDLSAPHLEWARRNFALNGINERRHELVQADCLAWLRETRRERYDVILLDPPTFSNSKRMRGTLDIARDHVELIGLAMRLLAPGGALAFSTNRRGFELATAELAGLAVEEATEQTVDLDFRRARLPHRCWLIRHRERLAQAREEPARRSCTEESAGRYPSRRVTAPDRARRDGG